MDLNDRHALERWTRELLVRVAAREAEWQTLSRDELLERWMHGEQSADQIALIGLLARLHQTHVPLSPTDLRTDAQRFAVLPSSLRAPIEQRIRAAVEQRAQDAFDTLTHAGFALDEETRRRLVEQRVQEEIAQDGPTYWRRHR